jgi:hypothetical protein
VLEARDPAEALDDMRTAATAAAAEIASAFLI